MDMREIESKTPAARGVAIVDNFLAHFSLKRKITPPIKPATLPIKASPSKETKLPIRIQENINPKRPNQSGPSTESISPVDADTWAMTGTS